MIHLDDGGDAFGRSQPQTWHGDGLRDRIAIERDDGERVPGQGQTADFRGAAVQDVEQHALALLHSDGLAASEHLPIDGEGAIANFKAVWHAFGERCIHGTLARFFQFFYRRGGREEIHGHVAASAQRGLELFQREKNLSVVGARIVPRLDVNGPHQTGILTGVQVGPRAHMSVVKAVARRPGSKRDPAASVRRDVGRPFFGRTVDVGGEELAMPVQLFGNVGPVVDFDGDRFAFLESQQRAGELTVVGSRGNNPIRSQFHRFDGDVQGVIRGGRLRWRYRLFAAERTGNAGKRARGLQQITARNSHAASISRRKNTPGRGALMMKRSAARGDCRTERSQGTERYQ